MKKVTIALTLCALATLSSCGNKTNESAGNTDTATVVVDTTKMKNDTTTSIADTMKKTVDTTKKTK